MNSRTIFFSVILLFTFTMVAWAQDETIDLSNQGFTNGQLVEEVSGTGCKVEFARGANDRGVLPRYYDNGTAVRVYFGNTMTVTANGADAKIVQINLIFGSGDGRNDIQVGDVGTYAEGVWEGNANSVTFSIGGKNGHRRIHRLEITYKSPVDAPVITSYSGSTIFQNYVDVRVQAENGATIRYTTDGTTPNENSLEYVNHLTFSQTTFLKAIAIKDGVKSNVSSMLFVKDVGLWSGTGSKTDPFIIDNTDKLDQLAERVNAGESYAKTYFKVTNDIAYSSSSLWNDVSNQENNYTRIGTSMLPFQGIFDGDGYTISGIRIYSNSSYNFGLFGYLGSGAVVKNVTIADTRITAGDNTGAIVGRTNGGATVENCHVLSDVCIHDEGNNNWHGGVVGYVYAGSIKGCTCRATLTIVDGNKSGSCGGIAGRKQDGSIVNCLAINVHLPAVSSFNSMNELGVVMGNTVSNELSGNLYYDCFFGDAAATRGIGSCSYATNGNEALPAHSVTFDCERLAVLFDGVEPDPDVVEVYDGGLAYKGKFYAAENKAVTFSLMAPEGFEVKEVKATGGTVAENADGSYTLTMPAEDVVITASLGAVGTVILQDREDNSDVLTTYDGVTADVTLQGRTLWKDGSWNTLCLPFSLSSLDGTPLEGATVKALETSSFESGTLTLNFTKDEDNLTSIEAGVPYIVKWTSGNPVTDPTFENVTISNTSSPVTTDEVSFTGLYSPLTVGEKKPVTYAVAELSGKTLTFKMTDVEPDGVTSWDASNTSNDPGWNNPNASFTKVVFDPSFANARPKNCSGWFSNSNVSSITGMENLNTSEVTSMFNMFGHCYDLGSVDVSHFDTRKVTNMGQMFGGAACRELDLSSFDTSNVENMTEMFGACAPLMSIIVSDGWSLEKVTASASMFRDCENLVGGAGTAFDGSHDDAEYAHIDGGSSNPGYLTQGTKPSYEPIGEEGDYSDRTVLYLGADNTLYYPSEAVTIGAFRAYFKLQGELTAGDPDNAQLIRAFQLNFGDEETAITSIVDDESLRSVDENWYTFDGRRLNRNPVASGIYINHGRKIIIK